MAVKASVGESGQMTVELCLVFPVVIVVAVIAVNALLFFGQCAAFDRLARNAVRVVAASPSTQESATDLAARIQSMVSEGMDGADVACAPCGAEGALTRFQVTCSFQPTLFGRGLRSQVWGVPLPALVHSTELALEVYAPGAQVTADG